MSDEGEYEEICIAGWTSSQDEIIRPTTRIVLTEKKQIPCPYNKNPKTDYTLKETQGDFLIMTKNEVKSDICITMSIEGYTSKDGNNERKYTYDIYTRYMDRCIHHRTIRRRYPFTHERSYDIDDDGMFVLSLYDYRIIEYSDAYDNGYMYDIQHLDIMMKTADIDEYYEVAYYYTYIYDVSRCEYYSDAQLEVRLLAPIVRYHDHIQLIIIIKQLKVYYERCYTTSDGERLEEKGGKREVIGNVLSRFYSGLIWIYTHVWSLSLDDDIRNASRDVWEGYELLASVIESPPEDFDETASILMDRRINSFARELKMNIMNDRCYRTSDKIKKIVIHNDFIRRKVEAKLRYYYEVEEKELKEKGRYWRLSNLFRLTGISDKLSSSTGSVCVNRKTGKKVMRSDHSIKKVFKMGKEDLIFFESNDMKHVYHCKIFHFSIKNNSYKEVVLPFFDNDFPNSFILHKTAQSSNKKDIYFIRTSYNRQHREKLVEVFRLEPPKSQNAHPLITLISSSKHDLLSRRSSLKEEDCMHMDVSTPFKCISYLTTMPTENDNHQSQSYSISRVRIPTHFDSPSTLNLKTSSFTHTHTSEYFDISVDSIKHSSSNQISILFKHNTADRYTISSHPPTQSNGPFDILEGDIQSYQWIVTPHDTFIILISIHVYTIVSCGVYRYSQYRYKHTHHTDSIHTIYSTYIHRIKHKILVSYQYRTYRSPVIVCRLSLRY